MSHDPDKVSPVDAPDEAGHAPISDTTPIAEAVLKQIAEANARLAAAHPSQSTPPDSGATEDPRD